jgi:hypothetical protein
VAAGVLLLAGVEVGGILLKAYNRSYTVFRFIWKWRKRSAVRIMERTHKEPTEALYAERRTRHSEEASA